MLEHSVSYLNSKTKNIIQMGANILKGPILDKIVFDKKTSDFKIGLCEMQGWRKTMEDSSIAHIHFDQKHSLFGIMDGHGGKNMIIKQTKYIST